MSPRLLHLLRSDKASARDYSDGMAASVSLIGFSVRRRTRIGYGHGSGRWVRPMKRGHSFKLAD